MPSSSSAPASGRLGGRIALITGASRGLGAAVAQRLAAEGAHLVLVARTVGGLEECDDAIRKITAERAGDAVAEAATLVPADLTKPNTVEALAASVLQRFGRLDILVAAAATLGELSPVAYSDEKVWATVLETNLTVNYRLLHAFDPLLRASDAGRVIFVGDRIARRPEAYWNAYAVSKAALQTMLTLYALETRRSTVRANLVEPGAMATALRAKAFPGEDRSRLATPGSRCDVFADLAAPECLIHGQRFSWSDPEGWRDEPLAP